MKYLRELFGALVATFRDGSRLLWLAPLIALIAGLPEFAQHVAEIKLGMFTSAEAFKALQNDPARWAFGYVKITGLFLAIFAAARYWSMPAGSRQRWWDLRTVAWRQFGIGLTLNAVLSAALYALKPALSANALEGLNIALTIATLPLMVYMLGGLFGDRTVSLRQVYRTGWWQALVMAAMFLLAMFPAQMVHRFHHTLAMGAAPPAVWALMAWDAVLVSLIACWTGTGLAAGYAAAPKGPAQTSVTGTTDPATPAPLSRAAEAEALGA